MIRAKYFLAIKIIPLLIVSFSMLYGQADTTDYSLTTPYNTIVTHLSFLQDKNYFPSIAAQSFDPQKVGREDAIDMAIKVKQILDGRGIYIDPDDLPRQANYKDSVTNQYRYYLTDKFPGLYLEKQGENWYYSSKSIKQINTWHKEVYPLGTDLLLNLLPKLGHYRIFGLYFWQLAGLFILIISCFILHKIFTYIFEKLIMQLLFKMGYQKLANEVIVPVAKPISFLIIFPLLILFIPVLQFPITLNRYIILVLKSVWPVFAIIFFYRVVDIISIYLKKMAEKTQNTLDDQLVPLLRKVLKTFVVVVGGVFILDNLDFDITGLIAGISIGGLAFALAAQDTIKNFFGSLMIFIDRPFQVGDWITSEDVDGTVEEVGFRSTRVRTFRNSVTYIPNGVITNRMIDNHGLRVYRRFMTHISMTYDTPPHLIEVFVDGLEEVVKKHPKTRKDYYEIHLNEMSSSSIDVLFYIFFSVPSWTEELRARHEVLLEVIRLADALGVNFAFPTQTLHVESFPEKDSNSPEYTKNTPELKKQLEDFLFGNQKDQSPES
ncbi:MAG: mechanosensitive ion channel family protein [Bacteroidota bacterium]